MAEQLLLFANELRTRAKEILFRAASTDDPEAQGIMRVVAAGYEKLARRIERRVNEAVEAPPPGAGAQARSQRGQIHVVSGT